MAKNEKEIEWPEEEEIVKYEDKYPIKEKNVKNEDLDTDNCCVCESTPDGLVFMKYNEKMRYLIGGEIINQYLTNIWKQ